MSPEQAAGQDPDGSPARLYAWACVLYEMLAGRLPFTATTPQGVLAAQLTSPPPPVDQARPGIPPPLTAAVMRCLAKDPDDR